MQIIKILSRQSFSYSVRGRLQKNRESLSPFVLFGVFLGDPLRCSEIRLNWICLFSSAVQISQISEEMSESEAAMMLHNLYVTFGGCVAVVVTFDFWLPKKILKLVGLLKSE